MASRTGPNYGRQLVEQTGLAAVGMLKTNRTPAARAKWLARRQQSLGASDIPCALGIEGAYTSPFALWWNKQPGAPVDEDLTESMEWGLRLEGPIADKFAELHPELHVVRPPFVMYRHPVHEWLTCSPDRFTIELDERTGRWVLVPLELKTDENADRWSDEECPPHIVWQAMGQAAVLGVRFAWVAALVHKRFYQYRLEFTAEQISGLILAAGAFWASLGGEPPDLDGHDTTRAVLVRRYGEIEQRDAVVSNTLADSYRQALRFERDAVEAASAAKNRLRAAMGPAARAIDEDGLPVANRVRYERAGYTVKASTRDEIRQASRRRPCSGWVAPSRTFRRSS